MIVRAPDFGAALELVNSHEYGNGVACFTSDGRVAREFTRRVKAGMVGINVPLPVPMAFHSFGGWKRSLFGDHHMYGEEGVRFYRKSGIYPINHGMVIRRTLAEQHPWAVLNLFKALEAANELASQQRLEHIDYHAAAGLLSPDCAKALRMSIIRHGIKDIM